MAIDVTVKRERWTKGYYNVIRDNKGHFIRTQKWNQEHTLPKFISEREEKDVKIKEEIYYISKDDVQQLTVRSGKRRKITLHHRPTIPKKPVDVREWKTYFRWNLFLWRSKEDDTPEVHNNATAQMLVYHRGQKDYDDLRQEVMEICLPSSNRFYRVKFTYNYFQAYWNVEHKKWVIEEHTHKRED